MTLDSCLYNVVRKDFAEITPETEIEICPPPNRAAALTCRQVFFSFVSFEVSSPNMFLCRVSLHHNTNKEVCSVLKTFSQTSGTSLFLSDSRDSFGLAKSMRKNFSVSFAVSTNTHKHTHKQAHNRATFIKFLHNQ